VNESDNQVESQQESEAASALKQHLIDLVIRYKRIVIIKSHTGDEEYEEEF
jgi:hypothetical protein